MPGGREVCANLMRAPRARFRFNQREIAQAQQCAPTRLGSTAMAKPRRHARAALWISRDRPLDRSAISRHPPVQQCHIGLADSARPELLREHAMSNVIARDYHGSGSAAIEAVHNSRTEISSHSRKRAEMMKQGVHERAFVGARP